MQISWGENGKDIMVADIEEVEEMEASEPRSKAQCEGSGNAAKKWKSYSLEQMEQ